MSKGTSYLFTEAKRSQLAAPGETVFESYSLTSNGIKDYTYFKNISNRKDVDINGVYDVVAHGAPNMI